jgi:iron complex outermembrane receptor protein
MVSTSRVQRWRGASLGGPAMNAVSLAVAGSMAIAGSMVFAVPWTAAAVSPSTQPAATQPAPSNAELFNLKAPVVTTEHGGGALGPPSIGAAFPAQPGAELLLFEDMPIVVSAARQEQPINLSAVPVSLVTADDIHAGGLTRIPDLLEFVPGMDVVKSDRNTYAVGVDGLHHIFADRTLTLIDGRDAGSPVLGGADWMVLPIFVEDIERIEVVRGPGGAAWGANAFNGVINIITKKPEDMRGVFASSTVTEYGDSYNQLRWADVQGNWSWRLSLGYQDQKSSEQALGDVTFHSVIPKLTPLLGLARADGSDELRDFREDAEVIYRFSDQTKLTTGIAGSRYQRGDGELFGNFPKDRNNGDDFRAFARLDYKPDDTTSAYLQWFTNTEDFDRPGLSKGYDLEHDLEAQVDFSSGPKQKISIGGNVRAVEADLSATSLSDAIESGNHSEFWGGLFVIDRLQATDRLAWENQVRFDDYSVTGFDWSGRTTLLYSLDAAQHHILRLSAAKAFRAPLIFVRDVDGEGIPLPPPDPAGTRFFNIASAPHLRNEEVYAVEAGYNGQLTEHITLGVNGFYQRYNRLIGGTVPPPNALGQEVVSVENFGNSDSAGAEVELAYTRKDLRLSAFYGYDNFSSDNDTRSFFPTRNQAGATARWDFIRDWAFSANYKFAGVTHSGGVFGPAPSSNRIDLTLSKSFWDGKAEIMVGCEDLLNQTGKGAAQDGQFTTHASPGRTAFVRLQAKF